MDFWGITDCGKVRRENQDIFKFYCDEDRGIVALVVCDGMGGVRSGNVASTLASEVFIKHLEDYIGTATDLGDIAVIMSDAVYTANRVVYQKSLSGDDYNGMGTTLTALVSTGSGEVVLNIGDSRAYIVTQSAIRQVTKDHTVVEDMVTRGDLTRAEARRHPKKNLITRAVGTSEAEVPDLFFLTLAPGEHILLCSDGLSNVVMDSEILFEIQHESSVRETCGKLVDMALSRGAPDNVTAVLYKKS